MLTCVFALFALFLVSLDSNFTPQLLKLRQSDTGLEGRYPPCYIFTISGIHKSYSLWLSQTQKETDLQRNGERDRRTDERSNEGDAFP